MARKTQENESFEDKLRQLEDLVSQIEDPACPLEKAIDLCAQGMKLYTELSERLSKLERKIYEVKNLKALAEGKETSPDLELFPSKAEKTDVDEGESDYGF
ncbi:exodeoxyribonuclease VII small subunit [Thermospira aquatica]|uniref:Exodeoxyribonuclease 7 small subunit n=1 Tax=Thermospira aquatica TaxID=2828656 RepID=A0AAX3BCF4_9SPIR|nr:exodeoxyribonuclease VII small subunit [Thermospira aquatica]URA09821.1 exodeoxyribonuclease VII small subunit [Thermospira aquatica]